MADPTRWRIGGFRRSAARSRAAAHNRL